jgi:hypothetical protein
MDRFYASTLSIQMFNQMGKSPFHLTVRKKDKNKRKASHKRSFSGLCFNAGHPSAFFRTAMAHLRTFLAMLCFVLCTLVATRLANVSAKATHLHGSFTAHAHELRSRIANGGALHVQLDAACHHFHILFLHARRSAMITDSGTAKTGFDAVFVFVIAFHILSVYGFTQCKKHARWQK